MHRHGLERGSERGVGNDQQTGHRVDYRHLRPSTRRRPGAPTGIDPASRQTDAW
jgi:hypothetical protein